MPILGRSTLGITTRHFAFWVAHNRGRNWPSPPEQDIQEFYSGESVRAIVLGRLCYRNLRPQPTASKPAPAKEVTSRTLASPVEKNREQRGGRGRKRGREHTHRSRGHARNRANTRVSGKKIPTENRLGFYDLVESAGIEPAVFVWKPA